MLGDKEDIEHRKQLAKNNKVRREVKIDLYKKFLIPILPNNCTTWGITKQEQEKLNTFHWTPLRRVIVKQYPDRIFKKKMQENLKCKSITIEIPKQRWQKFELYEKVPANEAMIYYFTHSTKQSIRGWHRTTPVVIQLNKDINLVKTKYPEIKNLDL